MYREKASGAKTDRAELAKLLGRLDAGDVLIVTRLDRLARSTRDLLNVPAQVTQTMPPAPVFLHGVCFQLVITCSSGGRVWVCHWLCHLTQYCYLPRGRRSASSL